MKQKKKSSKKVLGILLGIIIVFFLFMKLVNEDSAPSESADGDTSIVDSYAEQSIDLEKLNEYPFGEALGNSLSEIGADDAVEAVCEVDNASNTTIRVTTATKRLWVGLNGNLSDSREVEWIRDYDGEQIYYYISDTSSYNEPIYSYKTNELLVDKVDGESREYPYIVTASNLVSEINQNIDAAKDKYNGKWVQITGTVTFVSESGSMCGYYLYGKRGEEGLKITCWVDGEHTKVSVGQTITLCGLMREVTKVNNTEIAYCEIIKVE